MGTTLSGPQIYTPDWSNTSGGAGQGWGQGITALGQALFPNPAALAEARLRGAQTQELQQNIGVGQTAIGARSKLATMFAAPNAFADPNAPSTASSLIALLPPQEQAQARANMAIQMQQSGRPQAEIDKWTSGALGSPYSQTPTGVNAELQNHIQVANIGAGATLGAARIGAGATIQAANIHEQGASQRQADTPYVVVQDGKNIVVPQGKAIQGAEAPLTGPQAELQANRERLANEQVPVVEGGVTVYRPRAQATQGEIAPEGADVAGTSARLGASGFTGGPVTLPSSHGVVPGADATQPKSNSTEVTIAQPADASGKPVAQPDPRLASFLSLTTPAGVEKLTPEQIMQMKGIADLDAQNRFGKSLPLGQGESYTYDPKTFTAILARAQQLATDPRTARLYSNNPALAEYQALEDIIAPNFDAMMQTANARRGTSLAPIVSLPDTPLPPNGQRNIQLPAQPPTPDTNAGYFKPYGGVHGNAGPTPPPPQPQTTTVGQIPPARRVPGRLVVQGRLYTGGDLGAATSWRPATQAEVATAQREGFYMQ